MRPESSYDRESGYGLLGCGYGAARHAARVDEFPEWLADAVVSQDSIVFRVDLSPGPYWLEIFVPGGERTVWRGRISANDEVLVADCVPYRWGYEAESPPPYWSFFRKVSVDSTGLVLVVRAEGQPSQLAGLAIYPGDPGPMVWREGKVEPVRPLRTPNAELILRNVNAGRIREAGELLSAVPDREPAEAFEKAVLILALCGRLEVDVARPWLEWAARLLESIPPDLSPAIPLHRRLVQLFLKAESLYQMRGWDWAATASGYGIFDRCELAAQAFHKIAEVREHPLWTQALWQEGRIAFWLWLEQHQQDQRVRAQQCFDELARYFPNHRLLRLYRGEPVPLAVDTLPRDPSVPEWAYYQTRALKDILRLIHYWVQFRQAANGEMGGKYDDDVEMLRWWAIGVLAADDSLTCLGLRRIVEGIWNSDWIEDGYSRKVRDVEHAAEPLADTQPMMMAYEYGNPIYVERCMRAVRKMLTLWTGVTPRGHRHFRSAWYSSTEVDERPPRDCDVPMNARTVSAARWLAWYNRHPEALRFLQEWSRAWVEDCFRTDKGKPPGVVPAAVRFADDAIGGHSQLWYRPGLFWRYYDFSGGFMMLHQFLSTFALTGEKELLGPVRAALDLVRRENEADPSAATEGSQAWVAAILRRSPELGWTALLYRVLTGDSSFDDVLVRTGSDYVRFLQSGDPGLLARAARGIAWLIEKNWELLTSEAYFTDRVDIADVHGQLTGSVADLEAMYTGAPFLEGFYPFFRISWRGFGTDLAVAVTENSEARLRLMAFNVARDTLRGTVHFWSLSPRRYRLQMGMDTDGDGRIDRIYQRAAFTPVGDHYHVPIAFPPRLECLLEVEAAGSVGQEGAVRQADLAVAAEEIVCQRRGGSFRLEIPVHNIGTLEARNIAVRLLGRAGEREDLLGEKRIPRLEAPLDLRPRVQTVIWELRHPPRAWDLVVEVDPDNRVPEICETNNRAQVRMP
ncbi:MAG: hypothetical protein ONB23_11615 [candidate division KSB1 bacterium]|nr:hypothetical protein [candidate division KSB1 bacterium]